MGRMALLDRLDLSADKFVSKGVHGP
jgi:hypothetical protein